MKYFYDVKNIEPRQLAPGVNIQTMWGENIMMSLIDLEPHSEVPLHSHYNEQAGLVLEGEFEFIRFPLALTRSSSSICISNSCFCNLEFPFFAPVKRCPIFAKERRNPNRLLKE